MTKDIRLQTHQC